MTPSNQKEEKHMIGCGKRSWLQTYVCKAPCICPCHQPKEEKCECIYKFSDNGYERTYCLNHAPKGKITIIGGKDPEEEKEKCELFNKTGKRCVGVICEIHHCECKCMNFV